MRPGPQAARSWSGALLARLYHDAAGAVQRRVDVHTTRAVSELRVHYLDTPRIAVERNPYRRDLLTIETSTGLPWMPGSVTSVALIMSESDARRLHEALGMVLGVPAPDSREPAPEPSEVAAGGS